MRRTPLQFLLLCTLCAWCSCFTTVPAARGAALDTIGVTLLRSITNLDGTTVRVAQDEAGAPAWEVNPAAVGQPVSLFLYRSAAGTASTYPNDLGTESGHANGVAAALYGLPGGVATNPTQVILFDADYFINFVVAVRAAIGAPLVNQSFIFSGSSVSAQQQIDSAYDNYSARSNVLFVSAVGNGGAVSAPGTAYNGIGVGALGGASSVGPTADNGRCKPDLVAPAEATSFSTPLVTGAAALLLQAGARGDGGGDTNAATDIRTVKALLLNGAIKPADWSRTAPAPLDARHGAGVLNVFNSWMQLAGGKQGFVANSTVVTGAAHPPTGATGNISGSSGWDFNTCTSTVAQDSVNHYYFNLTNTTGAPFIATVSLTWNRQASLAGINDLDLFLYDTASGTLVASSTSTVDNVEHLYLTNLPPGRYDLQVFKNGGLTKRLTNVETYALAFEFFSPALDIERAGGGAVLKWPVYPAGFVADFSTNVAGAVSWTPSGAVPGVTNRLNQLPVDASSGSRFFRLRRP